MVIQQNIFESPYNVETGARKRKLRQQSTKNARELASTVKDLKQIYRHAGGGYGGRERNAGDGFKNNLYQYITNPLTNRKVNINGLLGKQILKNYIN